MSTPPFPRAKRVERGAAFGFAAGMLSMTATFGMRTAFFQPDYAAEADQLAALWMHGAAELVVALGVGFVALWLRRRALAKVWLVVVAIVLALVKVLVVAGAMGILEPNPWAVSPGTLALCAFVGIPVTLSFFPVVTAVFASRPSPHPPEAGLPAGTLPDLPAAADRPLEVRAALCVWLFTIGLGTLALGPDLAVRAWGLIPLLGAVLQFVTGREEERRLAAWVKEALSQGPPAYFVQEEPPASAIPTVYEGETRRATIAVGRDEAGSYRKDPSKQPVAAVDPALVDRPRSFRRRVTSRLGIPLVYTACLIAMSWPLLHAADIPPRAVGGLFYPRRVSHYDGSVKIPGLSLWTVEPGPRAEHIVGYDASAREVVQGQALFDRLPPMSARKLAGMANSILQDGDCCVLEDTNPDWPKDAHGDRPQAPFVRDGTLVYWRTSGGQNYRYDVPIREGMIGPDRKD